MNESMTITQAADILEKRMSRYHPNDDIAKATQIAIGALHYLQPANEPLTDSCECCREYRFDGVGLGKNGVYLCCGNTEPPANERFMFCPHCGKRLAYRRKPEGSESNA